ncbi:MAG: Gfo/Idh/MocA family oxidoreductase [Candidatus Omnitrophica bacterium]|nr:Gfo/Idh/MocA family oxidoreductase [Candidatus Omnitrophota bacterium]
MIRLGVIGYGRRAHGVINGPLRQVEPDIRVAAVVDPDKEGVSQRLAEIDRKDVQFYLSLEEMVRKANLDGIFIGTRCHLHAPLASQVARYDLPLFLEKPVAITMKQAISLEKAFENSRCQVVVSFPLRVSPLCQLAKDHINQGDLGKPVHVHAFNFVPYGTVYWEQPYRDYSITGGLFLQKATHDFDYLCYLMGSSIVRVGAMATFGQVFGGRKKAGLRCSECEQEATCLESPRNRARNLSGYHTNDHFCLYSVDCGNLETGTNEDCSSAVVEFVSGGHGVYSQVFFTRREAGARGAIISGYLGTLSFDWYRNELKVVHHHRPFTTVEKAAEALSHFGGDFELARDFIGLIKGKIKKSRTPIETGIQSAYICLAARESSLTGKFIKVRQVGSR